MRLIEAAHLADLAIVGVKIRLQTTCNGVLFCRSAAASISCSVDLVCDVSRLPVVVTAVVTVGVVLRDCDGKDYTYPDSSTLETVTLRKRLVNGRTQRARIAKTLTSVL